MARGAFNKFLSQMESVHQIAAPIRQSVDAVYVSDFIHTMFENKSEYGLGDTTFTAEWFSDFSSRNKPVATKFIDKILQECGHIVSVKSLTEGIDRYNEGFEDV
jgi:hypothetical protein